MSTLEERHITHPAQLQEPDVARQPPDLNNSGCMPLRRRFVALRLTLVAQQLSGFNLADAPGSQTATTTQYGPPLRLALLQPLADPAMFAACRRMSDKILDISALDRAWRRATSRAPPPLRITFDLRLPEPLVDGHPFRWAHRGWSGGKEPYSIMESEVKRLVLSIAIVVRARVKKGELRLALIYDGDEEVADCTASPGAMKTLSSLLEGIANF
ncbi:uncharacterized protein B0T15DRAFT_530613 [Chaetomium strumarium]|uniref:Uncharacterized protein n=1 Tax=Chaetomium strumarium TaxID=1170767 RepID=A0AAJ0GWT0_9PEZI|nr:hypothetical protein B0T15DRAFT_530613 [Chaetomium strumarium]